MSLEALHKYENGQICVLADKYLIRHPQWLALDALHELPVLWLETNEKNKSLETITQIWDFLFANGITRRGLLICVGGGVLTDIGGFAAATYKRGIDYINIPTTLLAMVDASSGGKTGINYQGLKNSIGVFSNPIQTLLYPEWLTTLPTQQVLSGYGEMLKTGLLNENLWPKLLQYDLDHMDIQALTPLIQQCLDTKRTIVVADPKEEGWRKVLNLGHTFGHALEEIQMVNGQSSNGEWLHGYAVVYGLIAELYLSVTKLGCPREPLQQLTQVMLQYYGKPQCKCSDRDKLIALMQQDKKNERTAQINCTLLRAIGSPVINQIISINEANEAFDYLFSL
jgi:3-dehydroquinate synthase